MVIEVLIAAVKILAWGATNLCTLKRHTKSARRLNRRLFSRLTHRLDHFTARNFLGKTLKILRRKRSTRYFLHLACAVVNRLVTNDMPLIKLTANLYATLAWEVREN